MSFTNLFFLLSTHEELQRHFPSSSFTNRHACLYILCQCVAHEVKNAPKLDLGNMHVPVSLSVVIFIRSLDAEPFFHQLGRRKTSISVSARECLFVFQYEPFCVFFSSYCKFSSPARVNANKKENDMMQTDVSACFDRARITRRS